MEGTTPTYKNPYRLSSEEGEEAHKQIHALSKGLIEPSVSPYGESILFVQKKDGTLKMRIDKRALYKVTVQERYPVPRSDDLLDKLHGCTLFSSLDLQSDNPKFETNK